MKTVLFSLVVLLSSALTLTSQAQAGRALDKLYPGYPATVFNSYEPVAEMFSNQSKMPTGFRGASRIFGGGSQCFHRAEIWSYNMHHNYQVNFMKVFVFYTHQYKIAHHDLMNKKFNWWFHVAPYTMVRDNATGAITEWVVDPTFANQPLQMKPWTDMFVETHRKCAEFVPFTKFKREVENGPDAVFGTEHCYIVRVPATDFEPESIEARETGKVNNYEYNYSEVRDALDAASTSANKSYYKSMLGF
jgi:hypothetical protein